VVNGLTELNADTEEEDVPKPQNKKIVVPSVVTAN
jgi:hypothetical protein